MDTAVSFFSGAGGLDIGSHLAGFDIRLSVEIEKKFCDTLKLNNPKWNVIQGDILKFQKEDIYRFSEIPVGKEIDLFLGGSPCQSFSTAGKREAFASPGGQAMLKYADLIVQTRPKAFLLENVKGLLSASLEHRPINKRGEKHEPLRDEEKRGSALKHILSRFEGYNVSFKTLNAADYGVPQTRERVFMVGIREDLNKDFEFPETTHNKEGTDGKEKWVTFEEVMNQLMFTPMRYQNYSQERLKYMKRIPQGGGNWRDLFQYGEETVKEAMGGAFNSGGGKVGFYRRIALNKPSPTLLTSPTQKSTNLGHPIENRPLSIEEYSFIQGFPPEYEFTGSLMDQYKQIGNAVPVKLAQVVCKQIYQLLSEKKQSENNFSINNL